MGDDRRGPRPTAPELLPLPPLAAARSARRPPAVWPIARIALAMLFRRRLFWALYALAC